MVILAENILSQKAIFTRMRKIGEVTHLPQVFMEERKDMWRQESQQNEQKRHDLLPEHWKMQKMSQELQIFTRQKLQC